MENFRTVGINTSLVANFDICRHSICFKSPGEVVKLCSTVSDNATVRTALLVISRMIGEIRPCKPFGLMVGALDY